MYPENFIIHAPTHTYFCIEDNHGALYARVWFQSDISPFGKKLEELQREAIGQYWRLTEEKSRPKGRTMASEQPAPRPN
jgi:hypothetical protein